MGKSDKLLILINWIKKHLSNRSNQIDNQSNFNQNWHRIKNEVE